MIREAVAHTRWHYGTAPDQGMITFVDSKKVKPTVVRGSHIYGYCYLKAGFTHVGFTKGGLWAWQMLPDAMPEPLEIPSLMRDLFEPAKPEVTNE